LGLTRHRAEQNDYSLPRTRQQKRGTRSAGISVFLVDDGCRQAHPERRGECQFLLSALGAAQPRGHGCEPQRSTPNTWSGVASRKRTIDRKRVNVYAISDLTSQSGHSVCVHKPQCSSRFGPDVSQCYHNRLLLLRSQRSCCTSTAMDFEVCRESLGGMSRMRGLRKLRC